MKKIEIFEPALCCETGVCGVGVDPELLRISAIINSLKAKNIPIERFNLNVAPMEFITNRIVNDFLNKNGADSLPVVLLDGKIILNGRYPTNDEFVSLLGVDKDILEANESMTEKKQDTCCSSDSCC